jgi:bifunctional DNase/RNase
MGRSSSLALMLVVICAVITAAGACGARAGARPGSPPAAPAGPNPPATGSVPGESPRPTASAEPPVGYLQLTAIGVTSFGDNNAVVLSDPDRTVLVPIFIGGTEALSISLRLEGQPFQRPLTHDLFDAALRALGGVLVRIQVDAIRDSVFIGSVYLRRGDAIFELDARPSDAIALAIGANVPIFVAKQVIDEAGVPAAALEEGGEPDAPDTMPAAPDLPIPKPDEPKVQ